MKLDKALSIWIGQLIITNCTVTDEIIKKRAKSICKYALGVLNVLVCSVV